MKNKRVFEIDKIPSTNTFELTSKNEDWWLISNGYYLLSKIGSEYVIEKGDDSDYLAYSVFYCFRHYLELELKGLTKELKKLNKKEYNVQTSHNLNTALEDFICEYEEYYNLKFDAEITKLIKQINRIDPNGQKFRYCWDRTGQPIDRNGLHMGFSNLKIMIETIHGILESIESHIDATNDTIQDRYTSVDFE